MGTLFEFAAGRGGEFKKAVMAFLCAVVMAALADFLFYDAKGANLSTAVFLSVLFVLGVPLQYAYYKNAQRVFIVAATSLFLLSVYWNSSVVGVAGTVTGLVAMRLSSLYDSECSALAWIPRITAFGVTAVADFPLFLAVGEKKLPAKSEKIISYVIVAGLTVFFAAVFIYLFSIASPQISKFCSEAFALIAGFDVGLKRFILWGFVFAVCFAFLMAYGYGKIRGQFARVEKREWIARENKKPDEFPSSVARFVAIPLMVFNLVFAVQNFFDLMYFLNGMALPEGVTYSEYANNGATALALATLTAAVIIIVCFSPTAADRNWRFARGLAYAWITQNILLCVTASARLVNYTIAYDLTVARLAGFSFFLLIIIGFVLSVVMISQNRRILWLINANIYTTVCMFVFWSFWDAAKFAADFNVDCYLSGETRKIDASYLAQLGISSLPARIKLMNESGAEPLYESGWGGKGRSFAGDIEYDVERLNDRLSDWRRWYAQGWLLSREIAERQKIRP